MTYTHIILVQGLHTDSVLAFSTTLLSGFSCGRAQRIAGERRQPATGATSLRQHEGQS